MPPDPIRFPPLRGSGTGPELTVVMSAPSAVATNLGQSYVPAPVALVRGKGPHLASETNSLRRDRLQKAAMFLIAAMGVFLIWRISLRTRSDFWMVNVAVMCGLGGLLIPLRSRKPMAPARLQWIEFGVFGLMAAFIAIRQYTGMVSAEERGASTLLAAARGSIIPSILLMFVYAMLIPNTWRAAAKVVGVIGVLPSLTHAAVYLVHPEVLQALRQTDRVEMMTENLLFTLIAAALSIFGTHVINGLRAEAFVARQLNQYRLVRLLGSGGMGDVYLAEHRMMKRPCALKLIRPDKAGDPRSLARFEQEVQATAKLSHPNTVEIYDYGRSDDGRFYYVMEYLPGLSLQDIVDLHGPMPAGRIIYLLRQACGALAEAHATGLIHRDLKPANIVAARRGGKDDVAKLLDFGLVKIVSGDSTPPTSPDGLALTKENTVQGTPLYMAPEQAFGRVDIDHRIDLYAIGGVAYTLLTARPPFERGSRIGVMSAHAHDQVVPPSTYRPDLPHDLERVILRCLAKDPAERFPDAESLDRALGSCVSAPDWDFQRAELWWQEYEPDRGLREIADEPIGSIQENHPQMTEINTKVIK